VSFLTAQAADKKKLNGMSFAKSVIGNDIPETAEDTLSRKTLNVNPHTRAISLCTL